MRFVSLMVATAISLASAAPAQEAPIDPEVSSFNERRYELPREVLNLEWTDEARASRFEEFRLLLARFDSACVPQDIPEGDVPSFSRKDSRASAAELLLVPEAELSASQRELRNSVVSSVERLRSEGFFDDLEAMSRDGPVLSPMTNGLYLFHLIPELSQVRALARLHFVLIELSIRSGDCANAARQISAARFLADSAAHVPAALGRLVGVSIDDGILNAIEAAALKQSSTLDAACLEALLSALKPRDHRALACFTFQAEQLTIGQAIAFVYVDGPNGKLVDCNRWVTLFESKRLDALAECLKIRFLGNFYEDFEIARLDEYFNTALRFASQRPAVAPERYRAMYQAIDDLRPNGRGSLTYLVMPILDRALHELDKSELREAGVRLRLALAIYRARHSQYPTSLADLVPDILPEPIADPYAAEGPLRYRRVGEGKDADYLLYSVGLDGIDNEGRADPDQPEIALRSPDSGLDWVIHRPAEVGKEQPQ